MTTTQKWLLVAAWIVWSAVLWGPGFTVAVPLLLAWVGYTIDCIDRA